MKANLLSYFVNVKTMQGTYIEHNTEFNSLNAALTHVDKHYLKSPSTPITNNAYLCVSDGKITSITFNGATASAFFQDKWHSAGIKNITIQNDAALAHSAMLESSQAKN